MARDQFLSDPHRPRYHFLPPANWMNDPNGVGQWGGEYHMFYQHNPAAAVWGPMHWGHAVSPDLIHWEDLPIALEPTPGSPDAEGCWSGVLVDNGGVPTLIYSGNSAVGQRACLATSADGLRTWVKDPANPVIPETPPELDLLAYRDHCIWREDDGWHHLIGAGIRGQGGTVLQYRSDDLHTWEYLGPISTGSAADTGEIWECPDLFRLGDWHFLLVSPIPLKRAVAFAGTFDGRSFTTVRASEVDAGGHLYAPQSFVDQRGRRVLFGWLWEGRSEAAQAASGWAGVMSLPRVLSASPDGRLLATPAEELAQLRQRSRAYADLPLLPGATVVIEETAGDSLELLLALDPGDATQITLALRRSPDGAEETRLIYDIPAARLDIDRSHASLDPEAHRDPFGVRWAHGADRLMTLRVFIDRSVIEVFAEGECLSTRVYPMRADSLGLALTAYGGEARLIRADIWEMRSIWGSES
jgi:beta-fructofuranosidase